MLSLLKHGIPFLHKRLPAGLIIQIAIKLGEQEASRVMVVIQASMVEKTELIDSKFRKERLGDKPIRNEGCFCFFVTFMPNGFDAKTSGYIYEHGSIFDIKD